MIVITFTEILSYCPAHHLPNTPAGHKCREIHGHVCDLHVEVVVSSSDFLDHAVLRAACWAVVRQLDHAGIINNIDPALADGTVESQLRWFWPQIDAAVSAIGCELRVLHLDEWSAPGGVRLKHRKSMLEPEPVSEP